MGSVRFIFTLVFMLALLCAISIAWPRITNVERPPQLTTLRNFALQYPAGITLARILETTDEATSSGLVNPNFAQLAATGVVQGIASASMDIVLKQAVNQIITNFSSLSEEKKMIIREVICKP